MSKMFYKQIFFILLIDKISFDVIVAKKVGRKQTGSMFRGLNMRARRDAIRSLVDDVKVSLVCLQETKLESVPKNLC